MNCVDSQYFTVSHCSEIVCTKIAPGMSYFFKVTFTADELKDYKHEVVFVTEKERFTLTLLGYLKIINATNLQWCFVL